MYKQFCKNLRNYYNIISLGCDEKDSRINTAEVLLQLTDIEEYKRHKINKSNEYYKISSFIYMISEKSHIYPSFKRFTWELWAYGFDILEGKQENLNPYEFDEVYKLADLMLSTHYI